MKKVTTMSNKTRVCDSCKKELVAGPYPKWFCLHENCNNYLKPIETK
jgi:hypothetical protein